MRLPEAIDLPPVWLAGFAALAFAQARVWPPGDLGGFAGLGALGDALGAILVALGAAAVVAAIREFRRHRTTVVPHQDPSAIVTTGIYRHSRNPIYLGDLAILAGLCLIWDALPALVLVPVLAFVLDRRFIRPEEARLRARFVAEFEAWAARTRRWI